MSILTDPLPEEINGVPVRTDFRVMLLFEQLIRDRDVPEPDKIALALELFYPEPPSDLSAAVSGLLHFYQPQPGCFGPRGQGGREAEAVYDFERDADYIYAAFLAQYGIDLVEAHLHWWKFKALFAGLTDANEIVKIMGYRAADLRRLKGEQKAFYKKMQELYRLDSAREPERLSTAAYEKSMRDYVAKRFAETKSAAP